MLKIDLRILPKMNYDRYYNQVDQNPFQDLMLFLRIQFPQKL